MGVVLAIGGRPELNDHEAQALAMLLNAIGTPPAKALAARLDPRHANGELELSDLDRRVFLDALAELRDDLMPHHLIALEATLSDELRGSPFDGCRS